jgi:maleamate amidohydrolase
VSSVADASLAERTTDYAQAGFGHRLGAGRSPALLIVDVVDAYLRVGSPLFAGVDAEVAKAGQLAALARASGVPVVLTRVSYQAGGADGGLFYRKVPALEAFLEGSPDGALAKVLDVADTDLIVTKQYASAFFGTTLASTLHTLSIDTVLIAGLTTSGCVRASAVDALGHGFRPLVIADAVGDRDPDIHRMNLFDIDQKYADVITSVQAQTLLAMNT